MIISCNYFRLNYKHDWYYSIIEKQPEFRGGSYGLTNFIGKNFKVPNMDRNFKGRLIVKFTIDANAMIFDVYILESLNKKIDEEGIRVVKSSEKHLTAGEYRGIKMNVKYKLPIIIDIKVDTEYGSQPNNRIINNHRVFK